jgi:hypothetical protein
MEMGQYAIIRGELHCAHLFCYVAQQAKLGPGRLTVEVSRSHTIVHTHPVGLLCTSDQLVAEAATYTTHNKHKRWTSMPSGGIEPVIQEMKRLQTYVNVDIYIL